MELLAVRTARLIAYFNAEELNPAGRPLAHDFMRAFIERYAFIKFPTTANEILDSENKGVSFEQGRLGNVALNNVRLFDWGMAIETASSTDDSESVLQDMLNWGHQTFGTSNRPSLVTRRNYVSEIVFTSGLSLPLVNPAINQLGEQVIGSLVAEYIGSSAPFEIVSVSLAFDATQTKQLFTPFTIQRLDNTSFALSKYYSGAPLKTSDHINVVGEIERILST